MASPELRFNATADTRPELSFNTTADTCIGILLSFCSVIGIIFNGPSLAYFLTQSPRSNNASYFQRIYQIIATIDLLICLTLFPFIDSAFSPDRRGTLLNNGTVCNVWSILWAVLPEMSVFMVAIISVSRLLLLMNPHRVFKPVLGWLVPSFYCIVTVTIKLILRLQGVTEASYRKKSISCSEIVKLAGQNSDYIPTEEEWAWDIAIKILASIQSGMTAIPITLSCTITVIYLYKPRGGVVKGSTKFETATITVIIITIVYIMFNIPVLGVHILVARWTSSVDSGNMTLTQIQATSSEYFNTEFLKCYALVLFLVCFTSLNSAVNPLVYYTRMIPFKAFVNSKITNIIRSEHKRGGATKDEMNKVIPNVIEEETENLALN